MGRVGTTRWKHMIVGGAGTMTDLYGLLLIQGWEISAGPPLANLSTLIMLTTSRHESNCWAGVSSKGRRLGFQPDPDRLGNLSYGSKSCTLGFQPDPDRLGNLSYGAGEETLFPLVGGAAKYLTRHASLPA
jgi:hypothetical protein